MENINPKIGKEITILVPFIKEPWRQFTFSEIKELTGYKSQHYVYDALENFSKDVLKKEKKGNTNIYSVNENVENLVNFILVEMYLKEKNSQIPIKTIGKIQNKMKSFFYSLLITGSYAKNKQKKSSDLDIAIIIPNRTNKKPYEIALKEGELTIPEVHGFVFTEDEFYQMLVNEEYNYGKECAKNNIMICGIDAYYKILLRGLRNGFKG